jgi:hypothetical protein
MISEDAIVGLVIVSIIGVGLPAYHKHKGGSELSWMDWCGYYAMIGVAVLLASAFIQWPPLTTVGLFLLVPLYPIAILGIIGRLDEVRASAIRHWRRR